MYERAMFLLKALHEQQMIADGLHLDVVQGSLETPDDVARNFGLKEIGAAWREVDRSNAIQILRNLLAESMAHQSPRLEPDQVTLAIDQFMSSFTEGAAFFTNGTWETGPQKGKHSNTVFGPDWEPVTQATFDGGIVALGLGIFGILWIEDED